MNRFATSRCSVWAHPSPSIELPPFETVPFSPLISASMPEVVAFRVPEKRIGCPGRSVSSIPSCPAGIISKVDLFLVSEESDTPETLAGNALSAWRMMYWWGGQLLGASLEHLSLINTYLLNVIRNNIPLKSRINKRCGDWAVVPIECHVDGREEAKRFFGLT